METRDEHFDLVSVLYHTLKQANSCEEYKASSSEAGDIELSELFGEISIESKQRAQQIKALLADRIMETADSSELEMLGIMEEEETSGVAAADPH
jgi:hypothetical protein